MNLKEIGITQIRLESKGSTKELDALQEEFNDEVFFYFFFDINTKTKNHLLYKIEQIGKKAKELNWPLSKGKRREEFIQALRNRYRLLKQYVPEDNDEAVCKMMVARYLKGKKECICLDDVFYQNWLIMLNRFLKTYVPNESLKSVYFEVLKYFENKIKGS